MFFMRPHLYTLTALLMIFFSVSLSTNTVEAQSNGTIKVRGSVVDPSNDPIVGAIVELQTDLTRNRCLTDTSGNFNCLAKGKEIKAVTVRADGFSILRQASEQLQDLSTPIILRLEPGELSADVVVSTSRTQQALIDTAESIDSVTEEEIENSPAPVIDGILEQSVGFSLFRRADSRHANPTTQGASLRGINPSGASRTRVDFDGIPLNDPFGAWVLWNRVSRLEIERIEVLRGGSSPLYGSGAVGGTISLVPKQPNKRTYITGEISGGNMNTFDSGVGLGLGNEGWFGLVHASTFQTKGYRIVDENVRGTVDDFANSRNTNVSGRFLGSIGSATQLKGGARLFGEARNNGTPVQKNRTYFRQFDFGVDFKLNDVTHLKFRGFGSTQVLNQDFSAVFGSRNGEIQVRSQRVPSQRTGATASANTVFRGNAMVFGGEFMSTKGSSDETGFFGGNPTSFLGAGGKEERWGVYFQDYFSFDERLSVTGRVRLDSWENSRGLRTLTRISTQQSTVDSFPSRREIAVSPGASILYRLNGEWRIFFNAGRSFRAPTLNELYRGFRVGSVVTDPNEDLVAERSTSYEGGFKTDISGHYLQASFFNTTVDDAVSNVTFDPGPPLILRQRRNASEIRSRGVEVEGTFRLPKFELDVGYLFTDSEIVRFQANPALVGLDLPQVPRHRVTFQIRTSEIGKWNFALMGNGAGSQFDDDLNQISLGRFGRLDAFASRSLNNGRFFVSLQNLTNSRASVRLTPVRVLSAPISVRAGFSWN